MLIGLVIPEPVRLTDLRVRVLRCVVVAGRLAFREG